MHRLTLRVRGPWARKPAALDHVHAAAVPLAAPTAWQTVVDTARVQAGQRVLITAAAGGVGRFAVQFARHLGAHVIATAGAARHPWLKELGADETIDYTTRFEDATEDVGVVIDLVGDAHDRTRTRSLALHAPDLPRKLLAWDAVTPSNLKAHYPNAVDGDPYGSSAELDQALMWRPLPGAARHVTPVPGLWHIGASAHPGPGLGAGSGHLVAQRLIRGRRR